MSDPSSIFVHFRCVVCQHRLKKPLELICKHLSCRDCLETILRNHRTDACCRQCNKPLENYQIEKYSFLSENHHVCRLLSAFVDVDQCETCFKFTHVQLCSACPKNQCNECLSKHFEKYHRPQTQEIAKTKIIDAFSDKEKQIIESMKNILTAKEFDDFIFIARQHLHQAAVFSDVKPMSLSPPIVPSPPKIENSTVSIYDWSKHPKMTSEELLSSQPKRVKEFLRLGFEPRQYQISMTRAGLRGENLLICLQTGAGKTFIAGMIAKFRYIQSIVSNRSKKFKAIFLVPIKALIDQQCNAFRQVFIDQPETILKPIDGQTGERFRELYNQFTFLFLTAQKCLNFLEEKVLTLSDFDLIIIDECHHCYDNHPTNTLMRLYHRAKSSGARVPQIIGLTASVGTNKKKAFDHLVHLCANLDCIDVCAIETQKDQEEVQRTTNTPMADTIITVPRPENDPIVLKLKFEVMQRIAIQIGLNLLAYESDKLENFLVPTHQTAVVKSDRDLTIGTDYLIKLNRFLFQYNDLPLKQCLNKLKEVFDEVPTAKPTEFETFCRQRLNEFLQFAHAQLSNSNPISDKLQKLVENIVELHKPNQRGLILVRTKFHTIALEEYLNVHPLLSSRAIKTGHMTGQGSVEEMGLPGGQQATVLKQFREGIIQILIATDVVQEGLDVPECSYVIRYEFVSNEIGTVQSRGRARAEQSRCYLITENRSVNYVRESENRCKEEEMKKAIEEKRQRGLKEFRSLVENEQDQLVRELCRNDLNSSVSTATNEAPASPSSTPMEILCRFCDALICSGRDLRLQGSTVVCIGSEFEQRINPSKNNGDKLVCPNTTCHKEIGAVILLSRNVPGYVLSISSLKFRDIHENKTQIFKKWSLYPGTITPLKYDLM